MWRLLMGNPWLTNGEIDAMLGEDRNVMLKARWAYIRLATLENHFDPDARTVSHWDTIDHQLQANRTLDENHINAWHRLICQKDAELFGDSPMLDDLDRSACVCPSEADVAALATEIAEM